jgi:LysM repeat protein
MYLNLLQDDRIEVGQRLIINPAISSADTKEPQSTPGVHVVRQGETLFSIAKSYGLSVGDIKATNNLSDDQVYIGQKLVVVK